MDALKDRRVIIAIGAAGAVLLGLLIVLGLLHTKRADPPAETAAPHLSIVQGRPDDSKLDPNRQLGCFVGGQYIGLATWAECAKRNGVATGDLSVGTDEQGALVATAQPGGTPALVPLPPNPENTAPAAPPAASPPLAPAPTASGPTQPSAPAAPAAQTAPTAVAARGQVAACWRYDRAWYRMSDMSQQACIQTLFAGRCEKAGAASYGRWGERTLRLVPGRVEGSDDNRKFDTVVEQAPNCSFPAN